MESIQKIFGNTSTSLSDTLADLLPKLVMSASVLVIGVVAAYVAKVLTLYLVRNVYRLVPRRFELHESLRMALPATAYMLAKVLFWLTIFVFALLATEKLGIRFLVEWLEGLKSFVPKVFSAIIIGAIGWHLAAFVRNLVEKASAHWGISQSQFLARISQWTIVLISWFVAFKEIGFDLTLLRQLLLISLGSLLAAFALGLGLGSRGVVANILSAYHLHKSFREGMRLKIEDIEGEVERITATEVVLKTSEGRHYIPASQLASKSYIIRDS